MIKTYLLTMFIILCLLGIWIGVQHLARVFAARHPEFEPVREEGSGCGSLLCLCRDKGSCPKQTLLKPRKDSSLPGQTETL